MLTVRQLEEIVAIWREYTEECREIAAQCAAEGHPSHDSNYELRCEQAYEYYREAVDCVIERARQENGGEN